MHSTASDGTMTPSQMAEECQKAGLCYAALTDHDCVAGVEEFMARAEQLGIRAVSGVEFSVQYEGGARHPGLWSGFRAQPVCQGMPRIGAKAGNAGAGDGGKSSARRDTALAWSAFAHMPGEI